MKVLALLVLELLVCVVNLNYFVKWGEGHEKKQKQKQNKTNKAGNDRLITNKEIYQLNSYIVRESLHLIEKSF